MSVTAAASSTQTAQAQLAALQATQNTTTASTSATNKSMGSEQFLKILVTQMTNQDPMNPMDDKEFIAQMAQFSSLDEMSSLNKTMTGYVQQQQSQAASAYLGRQVTLDLGNGQTGTGIVTSVNTTSTAGKLTLTVGGKEYDPSLVKAVSLPESN